MLGAYASGGHDRPGQRLQISDSGINVSSGDDDGDVVLRAEYGQEEKAPGVHWI